MSSAPTSSRRLAIAITAAVASATLAIGVTAATLLGWFTPTPADPVAAVGGSPPAVILVPIAPTASPEVRVAIGERSRDHDDDDHHGERHAQEREDDDE